MLDVGHAEVNDRLGLTPHFKFLETYSSRLLGMHIHDINSLEDHFAPFTGDLDFSRLFPYLSNKSLIKVMEAHSQATIEGIKKTNKTFHLLMGKK